MVIAFTGAGISKESGIMTFDEQPGIRDKLTREFATNFPEEYNNVIENMMKSCRKAKPNDAHKALAEYNVQIITMNIDGLHERAGSKNVLNIHGEYPNIVLYGDRAPRYADAYNIVQNMSYGDIFLVVGTSGYTLISNQLVTMAQVAGAEIVRINMNAATEVRKFLSQLPKTQFEL